MKVKLQARGIWDAIELGADDFQEDRMALEAILQAVPLEMVPGLAVKRTAKEAWEAIRAMRVGSDRVRKGKVQQLKKEFEMISFREGESVDDFALRLTNLVTSLATLGAPIDETQVVEKFLRVVPPRLSQIALAIETSLTLQICHWRRSPVGLRQQRTVSSHRSRCVSKESFCSPRSSGNKR